MTKAQHEILRHTLGLDVSHAPRHWRNHFYYEIGSTEETVIETLIAAGYMVRGRTLFDTDDRLVHATEAGKIAADEEPPNG